MNLSEATKLYTFAGHMSKQGLEQHLATHQELKAFTLNLRSFEGQLGEFKQEAYWLELLRPLKRYRFRLCATPLPFNDPDGAYPELFEELQEKLTRSDAIYPQHAEAARALVKQAQALTQASDNPLLEQIRGLNLPDNSALLIKESRYVGALEILLSKSLELRHLQIVTAPQLRNNSFFQHLALVGPMRWFPDFIATAPRSQNLHIVRYKFSGDGWQPRISFIRQKNAPSVPKPPIQATDTSDPSDVETLAADELLPPNIDWEALSERLARSPDGDQEFVEAKLCVLEGSNAVFLEADGSELILEPRGKDAIRRIKVSRLEPDLFLIVRERGSGDYIVPLANRILGERATAARAAQAHWKGALRKAVAIRGMTRVLSGVKRMGARAASESNIRNWMSASERKIRPRHLEDFRAVMSYLELDEHIEDYWEKARNINRAHQKAGAHMKTLLLAEIKQADLKRLEQRGHQSFALNTYTTSIHAYRIIEVKPKSVRIPLSRIGELLEL